jgi:hypothetical protein
MANLKITQNNFFLEIEKFEKELIFKKKNKLIKIIGSIRAEKNRVESHLENLFTNVHQFFCKIPGEYLIIIEDSIHIEINLSYSCSKFFISKKKNLLSLTQDEIYFKKNGLSKNGFLLGIHLNKAYHYPLGVFNSVTDFLLPGMRIIIKKKN